MEHCRMIHILSIKLHLIRLYLVSIKPLSLQFYLAIVLLFEVCFISSMLFWIGREMTDICIIKEGDDHYFPAVFFLFYGHVAQIPQCNYPISHNAPFCNRNVNTCARFCYKMVHGGPMWGTPKKCWQGCAPRFSQPYPWPRRSRAKTVPLATENGSKSNSWQYQMSPNYPLLK